MSYRWDAGAAHGSRVQDLQVGGRPVTPERQLRFTVNSFLADGGDGFTMLRQGRDRVGGELDLEALATLLATGPKPDPVARIRLD
jgi:5'-nucleotidase